MPKLPHLKSVVGRKSQDVEHQEFDADDDFLSSEPSEPENGADDILKQLRIDVQTPRPEDVLTTGAVKGVGLRVSQPKGYFFEDVHAYNKRVEASILWYTNALHQRDLDVHRLATEIDRTRTDITNLRFQMEMLRGKAGKALVNDDGTYVTESQISEDSTAALEVERAKSLALQEQMNSLENKYSQLVTARQLLSNEKANLESEVHSLQEVNAGLVADLEAMTQYADELREYAENLPDNSSSVQNMEVSNEELSALRAQLEESENETAAQTKRANEAEQELTRLSLEISQVQEESLQVADELTQVRQQLTQSKQQAQTAQSDADSSTAEIKKNAVRIASLTTTVSDLQNRYDTLNAEKASLEEEVSHFSQSQETLVDANTSLEQRVQELTAETQRLTAQNKQLSTSYQQAISSNESLEEMNVTLERNVVELSQRESNLTQQLSSVTALTSSSDSEIQQELDELKEAYEALQNWGNEVTSSYAELETIAESSNEEVTALTEQVNSLIAQLSEHSNTASSAVSDEDVEELREHNEILQTHVENLEEHITKLEEIIESHSVEPSPVQEVERAGEQEDSFDVEDPFAEQYDDNSTTSVKPLPPVEETYEIEEDSSEVEEDAQEEPAQEEEDSEEEPRPGSSLRDFISGSELPEGASLPTKRNRRSEFAPAAPGAPLTSVKPEDMHKYL